MGSFAACRGRSWRTVAGRGRTWVPRMIWRPDSRRPFLRSGLTSRRCVVATCRRSHVRVGHVRRRRGPLGEPLGGRDAGRGARVQRAHDDVAHCASGEAPRAERGAVPRAAKARPRAAPSKGPPLTDGEHFVAVLELGDDSGSVSLLWMIRTTDASNGNVGAVVVE